MSTQRLGIVMHGVTGRMGLNQHLIRSIKAIREQGGVRLTKTLTFRKGDYLVGVRHDVTNISAAPIQPSL